MSDQPETKGIRDLVECPHCRNKSYMEILAHAEKNEDEIVFGVGVIEFRRKWDVLLCPNCNKVAFSQETYFSEWDDYEYDEYGQPARRIPGILNEVLYPYSRNFRGTPKNICKLYLEAKRLIPIDLESALVKIRRVLEAVCTDKNASGKYLFEKLNDLADKGIIPELLSKIAHELRNVGNLGAHEDPGLQTDITEEDAILTQKLCETILEYVYEAPAMLADLEKKLNELKP